MATTPTPSKPTTSSAAPPTAAAPSQPRSANVGSESASHDSPGKAVNGNLKHKIVDALSGQTLPPADWDALDVLFGDKPAFATADAAAAEAAAEAAVAAKKAEVVAKSDEAKKFEEAFYKAIPKHDIQPAQQAALDKVFADIGKPSSASPAKRDAPAHSPTA